MILPAVMVVSTPPARPAQSDPVVAVSWKEPAPVKPWTGVRDSGDYGAACAQIDANWNKMAAGKTAYY